MDIYRAAKPLLVLTLIQTTSPDWWVYSNIAIDKTGLYKFIYMIDTTISIFYFRSSDMEIKVDQK